jgi:formate dehydrogenase subunit gamma
MAKTETREWRIEALNRLQEELEEELQKELGAPLNAQDSARIKELLREEIGERIRVRFQEIKQEILLELQAQRKKHVAEGVAMGEIFYRFGRAIRSQHFVLAVSVTLLIISGLPLRFHDSALCKFIIFLLGGIQNSTFLHRVGATGLMIVCVWHLTWLVFTRTGRREFVALLPLPKDMMDIIQNVRYFLRLTGEKARFDRFSYIEKFDYWAVYWGVVVMIGSGLVLWLQDFALRYVPKFVLDIAKEMHRDEALLASLAIVIWHMYNAHLNPHKFPGTLVMWNGLMTKEEMLDEHPLEYERLLKVREEKHGDT